MRTLLARIATLAATIAAVVACDPAELIAHSGAQVKGTGPVQKETRRAGSFERVRASGAFQINVRKGNPSLVVEAQKSLLQHIKTEVRNGELVIEAVGSMHADEPMRVYITTNTLNGVALSGACSLKGDAYKAKTFRIDLSGASKLTLPLTVDTLDADLSGASNAEIKGSSGRLQLDLAGASELKGEGLRIERAEVDLSGASRADLRVSKEIKGEVSGASNLRYRGNPRISVEKSGAADFGRA
ncbi:MAG: head GIN domain-containing protein [Fimbriimonas sp.]